MAQPGGRDTATHLLGQAYAKLSFFEKVDEYTQQLRRELKAQQPYGRPHTSSPGDYDSTTGYVFAAQPTDNRPVESEFPPIPGGV